MGKITIQDKYTIKDPLNCIGENAGICWGAKIENRKNILRAFECIESGHGRTMELPEVYMTLEGYSAKCLRELYTHIGGSPTRLQASTRYIDYSNPKKFKIVTPPKIENIPEAKEKWDNYLLSCQTLIKEMIELGVPVEDSTMALPLAYESKMIWKVNLRTLVNFMNMRLCTRAYWEIRNLAKDICKALSEYSEEWQTIVELLFIPKCEAVGYCTETKCCGRKLKKEELLKKVYLYDCFCDEGFIPSYVEDDDPIWDNYKGKK